jgi:hypothetical protein
MSSPSSDFVKQETKVKKRWEAEPEHLNKCQAGPGRAKLCLPPVHVFLLGLFFGLEDQTTNSPEK